MIALLASLAMVFQDITGVAMMQFEALSLQLPERKRWRDYVLGGWKAWRGAVMDELGWVVGITSTTISVEAFGGHDFGRKVAVFVGVSAANLIGSRIGQELGIWSDRRGRNKSLESRVAKLERAATERCFQCEAYGAQRPEAA